MPFIQTDFDPKLRPQQFVLPGSPDQVNRSNAPRGELLVLIKNGAIASTGSGDFQAVTIDWEFPGGFAWVHADTNLHIRTQGTASSQCDFRSTYEIGDAATPGKRSYNVFMDFETIDTAQETDLRGQSFRVFNNYTGIIQPLLQTSAVKAQIRMLNFQSNEPALFLNLVSRWYQYDIQQATHFDVNTPVLTR